MRKPKWKIAVLCGGDSPEREVSLQTGEAVAAALDARGHTVRLIDIRGRTLEELDGVRCDLAFLAMHGEFGEDGQIQLLLEARGIPYTGSGVEASRLAMDKIAAKRAFLEKGIPTPEYVVLEADDPNEIARRSVVRMGFPQVIKPANGGSSIGVALARCVPEAFQALAACFELDRRAVIERRIRGRELTVGILGTRTLPIIELRYPGLFFDQYAKYTKGVTEHVINPGLPENVDAAVRSTAFAAHLALGCRDISRVDLILDEFNIPYVLEINTIPGMTATSLVPDAARAAGIEFGELCETIARYALRRAKRQRHVEQEVCSWAAGVRQ